MAGEKKKYYTVWVGKRPGVYDTWEECREQTQGQAGAKYKSFPTIDEAEKAFKEGAPADYYYIAARKKKTSADSTLQNPPSYRTDTVLPLPPEITAHAIAVDAACSKNPGPMEYRGVDLQTGAEIFHFGPIQGTNNIGEFLAIVHCLALLEKKADTQTAIYSDSRNAILWINKKKCSTKLEMTDSTKQALELVQRAENWLKTHTFRTKLIKWETSKWGEIPADFGRK